MGADKSQVAFGLLAQADMILRRAEKLFDQDTEEYLSVGDALTAVSNAMGINQAACNNSGVPESWCGCAVCLNMDNTRRTPATTVVKGYSVCDDHAALVANPDFDMFRLRKAR